MTDATALVLQSKFSEALSLLEQGIGENVQGYLEAQVLFFQGKFAEVEELCDQLIDVNSDDQLLLLIDVISLKILAVARMGEIDKTVKLLNETSELLEKVSIHYPELLFRCQAKVDRSRIFYFWFNGDYTSALELAEGITNYLNITETPFEYLDVKSFLVKVYGDQLNIDAGMPIIDEIVEEAGRINAYYYIADALNSKGVFLHEHGKFEEALEIYKESSKYFTMIGNTYGTNLNNANISITLKRMGDFDRALKQLNQNINVEKKYGSTRNLALMQQNMGEIYLLQGDIAQAEYHFIEGLRYSMHIKNPQLLGTIHLLLGKLEYTRNNYDTALDHFNKLKEISQISKNFRFLADAYLYHLMTLLAIDSESAEPELGEFSRLIQDGTLKYYQIHFDLANALYLKSSKRAINQSKALEILQGLSKRKEIEFEHRYLVLINTIEILIFELQITKNEDVLIEIYQLVRDLSDLAVHCGSNRLILEIYLFESKIALLEFNIKEALRLVDKTIERASHYKIPHLKEKAELQKQEILTYIEKWEQGLKFSDTISILDEVKFRDYLNEISQVFTNRRERDSELQ